MALTSCKPLTDWLIPILRRYGIAVGTLTVDEMHVPSKQALMLLVLLRNCFAWNTLILKTGYAKVKS